MSKNRSSGFTLLELLVVIAIVGVLASIILVSLSSARQKARDVQRISDIRQIKNALQLYFYDNGGTYPTSTLSILIPKYIPKIPTDPQGDVVQCSPNYCYAYNPSPVATQFHLVAQLEQQNVVLSSDADFDSTGWAGTPTNAIDTSHYFYDVTQ